jgi:D-alanyl-D-alanine carboxypeptidase
VSSDLDPLLSEQATTEGRRRLFTILGIVAAVVIAIASVVGVLFILAPRGDDPVVGGASRTPTPSRTASATPTPTPTPTPTTPPIDTSGIDDPNSLSVVVNKLRPLNPLDYEPPLVFVPLPYVNEPYLRPEASDAAVQMFAAITAETGLELQISSSYRSYGTQVEVYQGWVNSLGQEGADLTSARPGYSEHQTGLAMDVSAPDSGCGLDCFGTTPQAAWVADNAWRFGFIVRYPQGYTDITGYEWEPWHVRYVGPDLAAAFHDSGQPTLEQYFGLPAAPTY